MQLAPINIATDPPIIAERWYQIWLGRPADNAEDEFVAELLTVQPTYDAALDEWHKTAAMDSAYKGR